MQQMRAALGLNRSLGAPIDGGPCAAEQPVMNDSGLIFT